MCHCCSIFILGFLALSVGFLIWKISLFLSLLPPTLTHFLSPPPFAQPGYVSAHKILILCAICETNVANDSFFFFIGTHFFLKLIIVHPHPLVSMFLWVTKTGNFQEGLKCPLKTCIHTRYSHSPRAFRPVLSRQGVHYAWCIPFGVFYMLCCLIASPYQYNLCTRERNANRHKSWPFRALHNTFLLLMFVKDSCDCTMHIVCESPSFNYAIYNVCLQSYLLRKARERWRIV